MSDMSDLERRLASVEQQLWAVTQQLAALSQRVGQPWGDPTGGPVGSPSAPPPAPGGMPLDIVELARSGNKIEAIKRYRELTGCSLSEAKDAVERI